MNKVLRLPVLKVNQPIGEFFIASINAKDLVEISYSDVRRLVQDQRDLEKYLGIQRPVSPKRIREIRQYLEAEDATFPTSVILAVSEDCAEYDELANGCGTLSLFPKESASDDDTDAIPFNRIAKVIDGQHRIAAFMNEERQWSFDFGGAFDINVAIFVGADVAEQANIFATVNLAQTKVNRSLVYDLTELAHSRSPHKTCHNVAVALDREKTSPFYRRIKRLGTATPGRKKEPLTQASFVEALIPFISATPLQDRNTLMSGGKLRRATPEELKVRPFRNLFLSSKETDITEILYNYFRAVERRWPSSWRDTTRVGNLLPRSNAFKALMVYLREDVYPELVHIADFGRVPTTNEFYKAFKHIELEDEDFTTRNFAPGSGGQSTFLKMLRGQISLEDMLEK